MPQIPIPVATVLAVNSSALQEQVSLQAGGGYVLAGAPGGPVVFASFGSYIISSLAGSALRTVANGRWP